MEKRKTDGIYMYHATDLRNLGSILLKGLRKSMEGGVYLADSQINALKFVALRGTPEILVVRVRIPKVNRELLVETSDHSMEFFQCKSWMYMGEIPTQYLDDYTKFSNPLLKR